MKKKQGISLIVLVITIIVMIILAAAVILSLNNAGIIGNANKAVSETDYKTVQTAAQLVYADMMLSKTEKPSMMLKQGEVVKQKLIEQGTVTSEQAAMYRFKNNGDVVKLQTKAEYEEMYKDELEMLDSSYYTITSNKEFSLTTAGKTAATTGNLTKLAIPYGVTKIHYTTATNCTKLTEVIMPDTLENIDFRAFANCENIETIRFSKNLKSVREEAFMGTKWLANKKAQADITGELVIEEGVLILGDIGKSTIIIPNHVDVIGGMAFNYNWPEENTTLKNVTVPSSVENIDINAFGECTKIETFIFLGQLPTIGWGAFGCWNGPAPAFANNEKLYGDILTKNELAFLGGD